jgi:glycosyltransferase involved in cell wall biosynthesis
VAVPRLSIVLPVFNEGENIAAVLQAVDQQVQARPIEVLVVYDFDEDNTVPVVRRLQPGFPYVRLERNRIGRGVINALRAGFSAAGAPFVLVMMADGSDEAGIVDAMLERAEMGADVVSASRYMRGGRQIGGPRLKRLLSRSAGLSLHYLAGLETHDATSNFRLYSRRLLESTSIESTGGFELALELTVKAHAAGMRLAELPTTWRDRTAGTSRFRLWKWMPHYLKWYRYALGSRWRRTAPKPAVPVEALDRSSR